MKRILMYFLMVILIVCPLTACSPANGDELPNETGNEP